MHNTTKNLLDYAIFKEAKEIDIDNKDDKIIVKFLIDGSWKYIIDFFKNEFNILDDIKKITTKNTDTKNKFFGRFKINKEKIKNIFNVSILSKDNGDRIILSLEKEKILPLKLKELGIKYDALKIIEETIDRQKGLILVIGHVGAGVTTTLYSLINNLNNNKINISSIENNIEYDLQEVNQTQINTQNGYTIKNGLHHLVRQNSDIIMINDINNPQDLQNTLEYASRGVPIFSSLNAVDINSALTNFLQIGIDPMQTSRAIDLIISQKLVKDKENIVKREYNILKMDDNIKNLFKNPRITSSQLKKRIEEFQI